MPFTIYSTLTCLFDRFRLSWGTQFTFWGFRWCLGLRWKPRQVFPSQSQNWMILTNSETPSKHHAFRICNGVIILWSIFYLSSYWECYSTSQFAVQRYHFPSTCKSSYFWTFEGSMPCRFSFRTTCTTFYSILLGIGWDTAGLLKTRKMKPNSWNSCAL